MNKTYFLNNKITFIGKLITVTLLILCMALTLCSCSELKLKNVLYEEDNYYTCIFDDEERSFYEYAPDGDAKGIIIMLHPYGSDGKSFRMLTEFDASANARSYVVVYPNGIINSDGPLLSTGWNSGIGISNNNDIGFINSLADYLQAKYRLTKNETFAAGFSNGAFMTFRIAVEGRDYFKGAASIAGMMPETMWDERPDNLNFSLLQVNGTKDDAVPMNLNGSALFTSAPAIEDVVVYFKDANNLSTQSIEKLSEKLEITKYFSNETNDQVWSVLITDGRHSWPDEKFCMFNVNNLILVFFDSVILKK